MKNKCYFANRYYEKQKFVSKNNQTDNLQFDFGFFKFDKFQFSFIVENYNEFLICKYRNINEFVDIIVVIAGPQANALPRPQDPQHQAGPYRHVHIQNKIVMK